MEHMVNFSRVHRGEQARALAHKNVCHRCIGESYLAHEVRSIGKRRQCAYCGRRRTAILISDLAEYVETAFDQHYTRTPTEPDSFEYSYHREMATDWFRDGEPVVDAIANAAELDHAVAADVQTVLGDWHYDLERAKMGDESEFARDSYYAEKPNTPEMWHREWNAFKDSLQTKARFFNAQAEAHLSAVFDGLAALQTSTGSAVLVNGGPSTAVPTLFRARVFQTDSELEEAMARPDLQLGPPPPNRARAGRMNAAGIPVFYGATDDASALAEVRPPVGSKVAIAKFIISRSIKLLNLSALESVTETGSIFDPTFAPRLERAAFLRSVSELITRAVMPDEEAFEYLPTQAVADFLASKAQPPVDGMLYASAQAGGKPVNVVLFHKSARVKSMELPPGTKISARVSLDPDGPDLNVFERVPAEEHRDAHGRGDPLDGWWHMVDERDDSRDETLAVVEDSVVVHFVRAVQVNTTSYPVSRYRTTERKMPGDSVDPASFDDIDF